jgi:heterodisulfide reductase subunit A-like polyferredoxin/coenzyme F420-reducing hydrogenase delta subunit
MTDIKQTDMEEITIATDVLVIGGGLAGVRAAAEIAGLGYKVILAEKSAALGASQQSPGPLFGLSADERKTVADLIQALSANAQVDVLTETRVAAFAGVSGDFTVTLASAAEARQQKVGAVVVAADFTLKALNAAYGLSLSDRVVSQSQLDTLLGDPAAKARLGGKVVAFLVGFGQEGNPLVMKRVMKSVAALTAIEDCTVYVYVNNIKVAADSLEKLYKEGRDKGAIYFKLTEAPHVSPDGKAITYRDLVVRQDVELNPDLIVVEEGMLADDDNRQLAELLRIDQDAWNFLQSDNVHRFPIQTNREGVFVLGASRGIQDLPAVWSDAENTAMAVKGFLGNGTKRVPKGKAVVDNGKCTFCLTCYRCCPHGAIYWEAESNKAIISPVACQTCGICASECPMDAIQIGGFSDTELKAEFLGNLAGGDTRIVAFCCQNSAFEAGQMAAQFKMALPAGLQLVKVPCAGKVDLDHILTALAEGADGVLVLTCHEGNCKSERGNTYASWRVEDAQRMLVEAGYEKDRLRFATLASNMGKEFSNLLLDMEARIKELGLSPLKN